MPKDFLEQPLFWLDFGFKLMNDDPLNVKKSFMKFYSSRKSSMKKIYVILSLLLHSLLLKSQPVLVFTQVPTITGVSSLVDVVSSKDGTNRFFLVQQNGVVKIWDGASVLATSFLDLSGIISTGSERGLLSIAFHPGYSNVSNNYFFVYYTGTNGDIKIARYRRSGNPNVADPASGVVILTIPHSTYGNHNGGKLNFGADGFLYFGTGDGGSGNDPLQNGQKITSLLGKMLRIDVNRFAISAPFYDIPPTNPFLVAGDGIQDEIYALGLRNPWRWSFDKLTGDMWIADVGQNTWEEVNFRTAANAAGINYQWRCMEGMHLNTASGIQPCTITAGTSTPPVYEYPHTSAGGFSITGGYVYRSTSSSGFPAMQGWYICADYVLPNAFLIKSDGIGGYVTGVQNTGIPGNITTFAEADNGDLFAASINGAVYSVTTSTMLPIKLFSFTANYQNGNDILQWASSIDPSLSRFEIERSVDGTRFGSIGTTLPQTIGNTASYQFSAAPATAGTRYYRLKMLYNNGTVQYSSVIKINYLVIEKIRVRYEGNGQLQLSTPFSIMQINIMNNGGQKVKSFTNVKAGSQVLQTGNLPAGMYWVQCVGDRVENFKIAVW